MTCIDAAIIRALVEHIGMNPDDVPIGGGSGSGSGGSEQSSSTFLDATWDDTSMCYSFTLPEGQKLEVGSIIRYQEKSSGITNALVIEEIPSTNTSNVVWYTTIRFPIDFSNPRIAEQAIHFDGECYTINGFYIDTIYKPNNRTTGIITNRSYAGLFELLVSIIYSIVEVHKAA